MSVGRNDPCPCESGRKYKKCCLPGLPPKPEDLFRYRIRMARDGLISKLLEHTAKTYGEAAIVEAWDEFHLWDLTKPFDPDSKELQVFMPWFLYNWRFDPEDTDTNPDAPEGLTPAISLLETQWDKLDELEREYIEACEHEPFSFLEIIQCEPGSGFRLRDVLTGREIDVYERTGSEATRIGDILFAKLVTVKHLTMLEGCSPLVIPPAYKGALIDLRKRLKKNRKAVTAKHLREYDLEILEIYQEIRDALLNPELPRLSNTDGEPLVPQKLIYEIDSPQAAFDALKDLHGGEETEEVMLNSAERDKNGALRKIEFASLREDRTVLAQLLIEGTTLTVSLNSEKRAKKFKAAIKKRLPKKARYKTTVIEPLDPELEEAMRAAVLGTPREEPASSEPFDEDPELREHLARELQAHWSGWIFEKIPALGNKTPLQAAKKAEGRERLEALLTEFERTTVDRPQPGVTLATFKNIREQLGLMR